MKLSKYPEFINMLSARKETYLDQVRHNHVRQLLAFLNRVRSRLAKEGEACLLRLTTQMLVSTPTIQNLSRLIIMFTCISVAM